MSKTRVVQVRLVLSSLPPHLELPVGVNHPLPPETRDWLFSLMDEAHVIRMDVTQLSPGELERLRSAGWPMRAKRSVDWWLVGVWASYMVVTTGSFGLLAMMLAQCFK
jgi:hypothetical protein